MELPPFLAFDPVPVRGQHNGWSPEMQRRFILGLARGAGPDEAARSLGRTRQSVYRLRRRAGAESFAAAWEAATAFATRAEAARRSGPPGAGGISSILVPRYYRGRIVGFVQRDDLAGLMKTLRQLDCAVDLMGPVRMERAAASRALAGEK